MIKQKLQVSKARISIPNTPPNQTAKAVLHSFSQSFKTLPPLSLKLFWGFFFFPFTAPQSPEITLKDILVWHHSCEKSPGIRGAKCGDISSDPGHPKRILQRGEIEFKYSGPLFSESPYQLLQCGCSAQILALISTFAFTLLFTFKETLGIKFSC